MMSWSLINKPSKVRCGIENFFHDLASAVVYNNSSLLIKEIVRDLFSDKKTFAKFLSVSDLAILNKILKSLFLFFLH